MVLSFIFIGGSQQAKTETNIWPLRNADGACHYIYGHHCPMNAGF
jgi:hypothetical protein